MTYKEIIEYVDSVRPNPFDDKTKYIWLREAEGLVQSEIHKLPPDKVALFVTDVTKPTAHIPYIRLYAYYLFSMIDFLTSDYDRYKISSEMFEKTMELYAKWYMRNGDAK